MKNYVKTYQNFINEALGVPSGLIAIATQIYQKMISQPLEKMDLNQLNSNKLTVNGDFIISDYRTNTINISYNCNRSSRVKELTLIGAAHTINQPTVNTNNLRMVNLENGEINLSFNWEFSNKPYPLFSRLTNGLELKNYLIEHKNQIISNLSHEIMHAYHAYKKRETNIHTRAEYATNSNFGNQINIGVMRKFIYFQYFISTTENAVRPSEVAGEMDSRNISQKEFKDFLMNTRAFKTLKDIREYTYERFIDELKLAIRYVRKFLNEAWSENEDFMDKDPNSMTDDEAINQYLKMMMTGIINSGKEVSFQIGHALLSQQAWNLGTNSIEFKKLVNRIEKHVNDYGKNQMNFKNEPSKFFQSKIEHARRVADEMIRKISKLHALAQSEKPKSTEIEQWRINKKGLN